MAPPLPLLHTSRLSPFRRQSRRACVSLPIPSTLLLIRFSVPKRPAGARGAAPSLSCSVRSDRCSVDEACSCCGAVRYGGACGTGGARPRRPASDSAAVRELVMPVAATTCSKSCPNRLREGDLVVSAPEIAHRAVYHTMEYVELFSQRKIKHIAGPEKWKPPSEITPKLNSDAAFTPGDTQAAWEVLVRENEGNVVAAAKAGKSNGVQDAFAGELNVSVPWQLF